MVYGVCVCVCVCDCAGVGVTVCVCVWGCYCVREEGSVWVEQP